VISYKAEGKGAGIFFNKNVVEADHNTGKIRLEDGSVMQGDLIICADGFGSLARKHLDYSTYSTGICVQCTCSLPKDLDPQCLYLNIIGEGYAWAFPKKDCANIGVGLPHPGSIEFLKGHLNEYIKSLGAEKMGEIASSPISVGGPLKRFGIGKLVVAGEAAGCVMPLSGEGNRFGIFAGSIAYKPDYTAMFMEKYGNKMLNSRKMLTLLNSLDDHDRIDFLEHLSDPLQILEGNWPRIVTFLSHPVLLMKLIKEGLRFE
jgi:flavin-dependent dehydrogenase